MPDASKPGHKMAYEFGRTMMGTDPNSQRIAENFAKWYTNQINIHSLDIAWSYWWAEVAE